MPKSNYEWRIMNYEYGRTEKGKHLQKTMKTLAEWDGAVAQVCVSFFDLLVRMFLIAFSNSWCHRMS
jgi:hypothetical protein